MSETLPQSDSPEVEMPSRANSASPLRAIAGYFVALGSVALVTAIKLSFDPSIGMSSPYILYFGAVLGSAWYGGFRPGLTATILAAFLGHFFFIEPGRSIVKPEWGRNLLAAMFVLEGTLMCFLSETLRQARRESERVGNQFRLLVDGTLNHCLILLDPWGNVKSWNHGARRVLGYAADEIVDRHYCQFFPNEDAVESAGKLLARASELGRIEIDGWRVRKDGSQFWAMTALTALRTARGRLSGFVFVSFDDTDRWRAEQVLRENERRVSLLTDSLPVLISYIDGDGRYQFNNATYHEWFGLTAEQCRGKHVHEVLGEEACRIMEKRLPNLHLGIPQHYEALMPFQRGGARYVRIDCIPHRSSDGRTIGHFALVADITERKKIESDLRASEERLRIIVDTAVDAIITLDRQGMIESVNRAAETMFGHSSGEMVGQNIGLFLPIPELLLLERSSQESARTTMRRMMRSGREIHALRSDGTTFPVEISMSEISSLGLFLGILRDVTQRLELEREVLAVAAVEQRRIGQELHDHVGQELTGLELLVETLSVLLQTSRIPSLEFVEKIATGLRKTHKDVRALARGLLPVDIHPNGLRDALDQLTKQVADQSELRCSFKSTGPVQVADTTTSTHLFRIAQEAVANAIHHGEASRIDVVLRVEGRLLVLEVRDDGIGIESTPFRMPGLGLQLMEYRASLIGGNLTVESTEGTVESTEGKGTTVRCRVPRKERTHMQSDWVETEPT